MEQNQRRRGLVDFVNSSFNTFQKARFGLALGRSAVALGAASHLAVFIAVGSAIGITFVLILAITSGGIAGTLEGTGIPGGNISPTPGRSISQPPSSITPISGADIPSGWPIKQAQSCQVVQVPGENFSHSSLNAVDITLPRNTPIYSTLEGIVSKYIYPYNCYPAGCFTGQWYGTYIKISNGNAWAIFAHLVPDSINHLQDGQLIQRGNYIGVVDNTGFSTGDHLHYELPWGFNFPQPYNSACQ